MKTDNKKDNEEDNHHMTSRRATTRQQGQLPQDNNRDRDRDRDGQQHETTKMAVAHDEGDNKDGRRTEGTGNGSSAIR